MISHPRNYLQQFSETEINSIINAALQVLDQRGLNIQSHYLCQLLSDSGCKVEMSEQNVRFDADRVKKYVATAPSEWTLHARNPEKNVEIGGKNLNVVPGYGSAFVADRNGKRRSATLDDYRNFTYLASQSDVVDITGGVLVEPTDIDVKSRHLEMLKVLLMYSDKPFMGSVNGKQNAADSIKMAKIALGDIDKKPSILALININSPLRLDKTMAEAMIEYINADQPVLFTPGIMMGITAPVTVAGALVQATAELMGCVAITQIMNPGVPVIIGLGGFAADLKTAGSGFGRPEQILGILAGAQIARQLKLPFRSSAMVTGSKCSDCRSGYERMMTAMSSWSAGTHFCLQAMGILDSINSMSYEQFIIDDEIWSYIKRISASASVDERRLAKDAIISSQGDYLATEHTLEHMRDELFDPGLLSEAIYENWLLADTKDVVGLAAEKADSILSKIEPLQIDSSVMTELDKFIACRAE